MNSEPYLAVRYCMMRRFRELFQWFLMALSVLQAHTARGRGSRFIEQLQ